MSSDDGPVGYGFDRMIGEERRQIHEFRRQIHQARLRDGVGDDLHDAFAAEILSYHDVLREFRHRSQFDDEDFPDIAPLRSRVGREIEVKKDAAGLSRGASFEQVPAVREIPISYLLELSHKLDDVAQDLGFGADAVDITPHNNPGTEDLEALLETRGQGDAIDNLPGGDG